MGDEAGNYSCGGACKRKWKKNQQKPTNPEYSIVHTESEAYFYIQFTSNKFSFPLHAISCILKGKRHIR